MLSVQIPKTGGTSVAQFLRHAGFSEHFGIDHKAVRPAMICPPQHYDYDLISKFVRFERLGYSFAIVRHPISRIISDYKWATTKTMMKASNFSFDEWVQRCFNEFDRNEYFLANHIKPQHKFVGPKISRVFKYEDGLNSIMSEIFNHCNFSMIRPIELPTLNKTTPKEIHMKQETETLIRSFYAKDFEQFGYD